MTSHDLLHLMSTNRIAFDQRDSHSTLESERAMDHCCQVMVSISEISNTITFTYLYLTSLSMMIMDTDNDQLNFENSVSQVGFNHTTFGLCISQFQAWLSDPRGFACIHCSGGRVFVKRSLPGDRGFVLEKFDTVLEEKCRNFSICFKETRAV